MLPAADPDIGELAAGSFAMLAALLLVLNSFINTRLVASMDGVTYWRYFKRHVVSWGKISSFTIGTSLSMAHWPCLVIETSDGRVRIDGVSGTRSFVTYVADDLRDFQMKRADGSQSFI